MPVLTAHANALPAEWLAAVLDATYRLMAAQPERRDAIRDREVAIYERLIIGRAPAASIYVHEWTQSDERDLHDHCYDTVSIILDGGYWEITPEGRFWRAPGEIIFRRAEERHRIELDPEHPMPRSLFIVGPRRRQMGFHAPSGRVDGSPSGVKSVAEKTAIKAVGLP